MALLSKLFYFELDLDEHFHDIVPTLTWFVHGFNVKNDNALGVDYPGTKMRVFGEEGPLKSFFAQAKVQRALTMAVAVTAPTPVPAVTAGVRVCRNRAGTRTQPARLRRFAKRNPGMALPDFKDSASDVQLALSSKRTQQDFLLKLRRAPSELSQEVLFNSYGLCTEGSSLPAF